MIRIDPRMSKIRQIDQKISKKCLNYYKNPTHDKKRGTCPQNPKAGPQTYWHLVPRCRNNLQLCVPKSI